MEGFGVLVDVGDCFCEPGAVNAAVLREPVADSGQTVSCRNGSGERMGMWRGAPVGFVLVGNLLRGSHAGGDVQRGCCFEKRVVIE